jgi:hypothetical protein
MQYLFKCNKVVDYNSRTRYVRYKSLYGSHAIIKEAWCMPHATVRNYIRILMWSAIDYYSTLNIVCKHGD